MSPSLYNFIIVYCIIKHISVFFGRMSYIIIDYIRLYYMRMYYRYNIVQFPAYLAVLNDSPPHYRYQGL